MSNNNNRNLRDIKLPGWLMAKFDYASLARFESLRLVDSLSRNGVPIEILVVVEL